MEKLYILREKSESENRYNAGSKAREDVDSILIGMGAQPVVCEFSFSDVRSSYGKVKKLLYHFKTEKIWKNQLSSIPDGSIVIFQFPVKAHTIRLGSVIKSLKKRSVKTVALIHDLDTLRNSVFYRNDFRGYRLRLEEISALKVFDVVIAHNDKMKAILSEKFSVRKEKIISLDIFDYLIDKEIIEERKKIDCCDENKVIIAGNLDPEKCGYLYKLPKKPYFELYGSNYKGDYANNIHYNGAFPPNELPSKLLGGYGLVWDGEDISTCAGIFGSYLKINNPHKTSLYLACGIPVIIWSEAAITKFVIANECGVVVRSINEIGDVLGGLSEDKYKTLKESAEKVGENLRSGYFTRKAIERAISQLGGSNSYNENKV